MSHLQVLHLVTRSVHKEKWPQVGMCVDLGGSDKRFGWSASALEGVAHSKMRKKEGWGKAPGGTHGRRHKV